MNKKIYIRCLIVGSILIIGVIWYRLAIGAVPLLDQWTIPYAEKVQPTSVLYVFFSKFTHFGSQSFLVPFTIILSIPLYMMYRSIRPWLMISGGTLFTYMLNSGMKYIMQRERPRLAPELSAEGFSFPSGHAMISFVFYSLLMYFLLTYFLSQWVRISIWLGGALFILLIGISRYILYVHYASDIVAGYLIGWILVLIIIRLYESSRKLRND